MVACQRTVTDQSFMQFHFRALSLDKPPTPPKIIQTLDIGRFSFYCFGHFERKSCWFQSPYFKRLTIMINRLDDPYIKFLTSPGALEILLGQHN